jgi:hypothetical protein
MACVSAATLSPDEGMAVEGEAVVGLFANGHADDGIGSFLAKAGDPRP